MGVAEEVAAYNELVSKAVVTFDEDLSRLEGRMQAIEALGKSHDGTLKHIQSDLDRLDKKVALSIKATNYLPIILAGFSLLLSSVALVVAS